MPFGTKDTLAMLFVTAKSFASFAPLWGKGRKHHSRTQYISRSEQFFVLHTSILDLTNLKKLENCFIKWQGGPISQWLVSTGALRNS